MTDQREMYIPLRPEHRQRSVRILAEVSARLSFLPSAHHDTIATVACAEAGTHACPGEFDSFGPTNGTPCGCWCHRMSR